MAQLEKSVRLVLNQQQIELIDATIARRRSGKPIRRGLINPEGDQSAFGDETAEVMDRMEALALAEPVEPVERPVALVCGRLGSCVHERGLHKSAIGDI